MTRSIVLTILCGILTFYAAWGDPKQNKTRSDDPCGIVGNWKNQLGSTMQITCRKGNLRGKYRSAVGEATDFYELSGRYTMTGVNQEDCIVGFSVAWNNDVRGNSNSTTSWTGLHYASEGIIHTHWILTRYREIDSMWATNLVGHDDFRRISIHS